MVIGILAIQGSVIEHKSMLQKIGVEPKELRLPADFEGIQGVILPGGESTTQSKLMRRFGIFELLKTKIQQGLPVWGTCAGSILLAKQVEGKNPPPTLELMNITADRNAYGSHLDSFETTLEFSADGEKKQIDGVFIRAPKLKADSEKVKVLSAYQGQQVLLQQGHMLASSFHPELTDDTTVHHYFAEMCK